MSCAAMAHSTKWEIDWGGVYWVHAVKQWGVLGQAMIFSSMNNLNTENTFVDLTK